MDNKQFPERDEEEIIPEELTFFPADEESEETGDTPVSEEGGNSRGGRRSRI